MIVQTLVLSSLLAAFQPGSPVSWSVSAVAVDGGQVRVELVANVEEGWHMYATTLPSDDGPIATSIRFNPSEAYAPVGGIEEPAPKEEYDANFEMVVRHHSGAPHFYQNLRVMAKGPITVEGEVEFMVCNNRTCLPPVVVPFKVQVLSLIHI